MPWSFTDYREYLRALVTHLRATQRHFSFALVSRRAGFRSRNYIRLVMDGHRRLSPASLRRFASALKLEPQEREAFETLVALSHAETSAEREHYQKRLLAPPAGAEPMLTFAPMHLSDGEVATLCERLRKCVEDFERARGAQREGGHPIRLSLHRQ